MLTHLHALRVAQEKRRGARALEQALDYLSQEARKLELDEVAVLVGAAVVAAKEAAARTNAETPPDPPLGEGVVPFPLRR